MFFSQLLNDFIEIKRWKRPHIAVARGCGEIHRRKQPAVFDFVCEVLDLRVSNANSLLLTYVRIEAHDILSLLARIGFPRARRNAGA